tara:strand:+ start:1270 stop:2532 length:1263 start_codon:yes stop_codon:yes gene_type:complete
VKIKVGVLGLGYVGLPLAVELSKNKKVVGYDINSKRIAHLNKNIDHNKEISSTNLKKSKKNLFFTSDANNLIDCNFYIVTVPTPVNKRKQPDLSLLKSATQVVANNLRKNDIVVFESTVYPGVTEEICVPILEKYSKLKFNHDFYCGYSPERINPGDKVHTIDKVVKITSGSNKYSAKIIDQVYSEVTNGNTFQASSIKVAEAAKVIENTQRDINIALMNELSQIFNKLDIDTNAVLEAANTKWNFLKFTPGLVGGHCIGVDPYYLTHKAKEVGIKPKIILAGRETNDGMSKYISNKLINIFKNTKNNVKKILIMGATFKEDCPDIRNSKVFDITENLIKEGYKVNIYDPNAFWTVEAKKFQKNIIKKPKKEFYDCIILAVPHKNFIKQGFKKIKYFGNDDFIFIDLKNKFPKIKSKFRL